MKHTRFTPRFAAGLALAAGFAAAPLEAQRVRPRPIVDLGSKAASNEPVRNDPAFRRLLPCCRVIAVQQNVVSVKNEGTGKVFEMSVARRARPRDLPGGAAASPVKRMAAVTAKQYRLGQTVFVNAEGNRAAVASLPVTVTRKDNIVRSSWKMETTVTLSNTGRIDGITKTKTAEALRGFTGGVLVGITDLDGNVLHTTKLRTYGVDGTAKPGGKSSRTVKWNEDVPKEALDKAAAVVIWHSHQPKNRFPGAVDWVRENWQCIVDVYKLINPDSTESAPEGGTPASSEDVWGETTPEETMEILSACKNLFG